MSIDTRAAKQAIDDVNDAFTRGRDTLTLADTDDAIPDESTLSVAANYTEPWNRLADEKDRAWEVFRYYRDLGPARTIKAVVQHFGYANATSVQNTYVTKYDWRERVLAYDQYEDRIYNAKRATAIKEMADRHSTDLVGFIEALAVPFTALKQKLESDPDSLDDLTESTVKQLIDLSVKAGRIIPSMMAAERLARGMSTEVIEIRGEVTHTHGLDRDQLGEVWATIAEAGGFADGRGIGGGEPAIDAEIVEVHPQDPADVGAEP